MSKKHFEQLSHTLFFIIFSVMAPHTMYISHASLRSARPSTPVKRRYATVGRRGIGNRSAALIAASKILQKSMRSNRPVMIRKQVRKQPARAARGSFLDCASEAKKGLIAQSLMEIFGMESTPGPMITRSRRTSVSSIESGISVESCSSVASTSSLASTRSSTSSVASSRCSNGSTGSSGGNYSLRTRSHRVNCLRPRVKRLQSFSRKVTPKKSSPSSAIKRVNREKVNNDKFILNDLKWSSWKPAMVGNNESDEKYTWMERRGDHLGVRNIDLFRKTSHRPSVYEFAVQTPGSIELHPVLCRATAGFTGCHWDTKLLNGLSVECQVDRVLKRGCKLYARRAPFSRPVNLAKKDVSSVEELRSLIHKCYDYAWNEHYDTSSRKYFHRNVKRNGVAISDNPKKW